MSKCPAAKFELTEEAQVLVAARFVRVPCNYLGLLLDRGRSSAHAVHLTAIKASKGPTFTLNEKHVFKEYGNQSADIPKWHPSDESFPGF